MVNRSGKHRILIVDDQPIVREGLIRIISQEKDIACCGFAGTCADAQKAVNLHKPDLVTIDLLLPDGCGLELVKTLTSENSSLRALIISQCDETLYAERALKAGARGFVMKHHASAEILGAIRTVLTGEFFVSPRIAALALHQMAVGKFALRNEGPSNLTNRELQIFQLIGAGISVRDMAEKLRLSLRTVETHRENIKHKLKFAHNAELIRYAEKWVESQGSSHRLEPQSESPRANLS